MNGDWDPRPPLVAVRGLRSRRALPRLPCYNTPAPPHYVSSPGTFKKEHFYLFSVLQRHNMDITGGQSEDSGHSSVCVYAGAYCNVNSLIGSQAASLPIPAPPPPHCVTLDDEPSGPTSSPRKTGNRLTTWGVVTVKQDSTFSNEDFRKSLAQSNYSYIVNTQR